MWGAETIRTATKSASISTQYPRSKFEGHSNWQLVFKPFPALCVINIWDCEWKYQPLCNCFIHTLFLITCDNRKRQILEGQLYLVSHVKLSFSFPGPLNKAELVVVWFLGSQPFCAVGWCCSKLNTSSWHLNRDRRMLKNMFILEAYLLVFWFTSSG